MVEKSIEKNKSFQLHTEVNRSFLLLLEIAKCTEDRGVLTRIVGAVTMVEPQERSAREKAVLKTALGNSSIDEATLRLAKSVEQDPELCKVIDDQLVIALRRVENTRHHQD